MAEQTLAFVEDYRLNSVLWDVTDKNYTNKLKRNEAYLVLATKYGTSIKGIKNKIKSLRSYFSKEHQKVCEKKSGEEKNESSWFAYKSLMFILDSLTPKATKYLLSSGYSTGTCEENSEVKTVKTEENNDESNATITCDVLISEESQNSATCENRYRALNRRAKRRKYNDILNKSKKKLFDTSDDDQIFGEYVASVLRSFSSQGNKKLRRVIQRAIVDIQDEEDDLIAGTSS